jgi:hypothetical protein
MSDTAPITASRRAFLGAAGAAAALLCLPAPAGGAEPLPALPHGIYYVQAETGLLSPQAAALLRRQLEQALGIASPQGEVLLGAFDAAPGAVWTLHYPAGVHMNIVSSPRFVPGHAAVTVRGREGLAEFTL